MKIAILQCDDVLDNLQNEFVSYSFMIQRMFNAIDDTFEIDIFNCQLNEYPDDIDAHDFYITTGSRAGAYEDIDWIQQLIKFIQLLDQHQKKLIGICFGHQLIAMAKNKSVKPSPKGWGVGIAINRITATPDWMHETKSELNIIVSHKDQVSSLPDEAIVIAESDFCPYFVVQWNNNLLSIQGHPEWNTDYSKALMNERRAIIPADRIEAGITSLSLKPDNTLFTQWVLDFVKH